MDQRRLQILSLAVLMLIVVASCWHSEHNDKERGLATNQNTSPTNTTAPAVSHSHLNEQLQSELARILPTEAGETESPDSVQRVKALLDQGADVNAKGPEDRSEEHTSELQ